MCNMGEKGWSLGKVIALNYREETWHQGMVAPYQVLLEVDHELIYVPKDVADFCRGATPEDMRISRCMDALDAPAPAPAPAPSPSTTREGHQNNNNHDNDH